MSVLHATFSFGGVAGALSVGVLLGAGVGFRCVYLAVLIPLSALLLAVTLTRFPSPGPVVEEANAGRYGLFGNLSLLFVAAIATLGLLSEGEMEHWSGIYLRDTVELPALLGGSGVVVFFGAMAVGRLVAAPIINRLGNRKVVLQRCS